METREYTEYEYFTPINYGIMKTHFKFSDISRKYKLTYSPDCVNVLYDYLLIYMKRFIRAMAEQKRKFRVVDCSELLETMREPKIGNPWEMGIAWHLMSKDQIEMVRKNDKIEKELNEKKKLEALKKQMTPKTDDKKRKGRKRARKETDDEEEKMEEEELEEVKMEEDKKDGDKIEDDGDDDDDDDDDDKKEDDEEEINCDDILNNHVKDRVESELIYDRYTVKDLLQLLQMNPFIIPKKPILDVLRMRAIKRTKSRPTTITL